MDVEDGLPFVLRAKGLHTANFVSRAIQTPQLQRKYSKWKEAPEVQHWKEIEEEDEEAMEPLRLMNEEINLVKQVEKLFPNIDLDILLAKASKAINSGIDFVIEYDNRGHISI